MTNPEKPNGREKLPAETERKFLIDAINLPLNLVEVRRTQIRQGYLVIGGDGSEALVSEMTVSSREENNPTYSSYAMIVGSQGETGIRKYETDMSYRQFIQLWPATEGKRVEKTRFSIPYEQNMIELDVYRGDLAGLMMAEVRFGSGAEADLFEPPDWLGQDVTSNERFANQSLAINGLPT